MDKLIYSQQFLDNTRKETLQIIAEAEQILASDLSKLNWKENETRWSVLEVLMHLNSYAAYYFPEFEKANLKAKGTEPIESFKTTWFGRKCVTSVHPSTRVSKKMNAPKIHNHNSESTHQISVVHEFLDHQQTLLKILGVAKTVDLTKPKVRVQIAKLLKLNLGEFLMFMCTHQRRHMDQALEVLDDVTKLKAN